MTAGRWVILGSSLAGPQAEYRIAAWPAASVGAHRREPKAGTQAPCSIVPAALSTIQEPVST